MSSIPPGAQQSTSCYWTMVCPSLWACAGELQACHQHGVFSVVMETPAHFSHILFTSPQAGKSPSGRTSGSWVSGMQKQAPLPASLWAAQPRSKPDCLPVRDIARAFSMAALVHFHLNALIQLLTARSPLCKDFWQWFFFSFSWLSQAFFYNGLLSH